jgi:hypothetical protein
LWSLKPGPGWQAGQFLVCAFQRHITALSPPRCNGSSQPARVLTGCSWATVFASGHSAGYHRPGVQDYARDTRSPHRPCSLLRSGGEGLAAGSTKTRTVGVCPKPNATATVLPALAKLSIHRALRPETLSELVGYMNSRPSNSRACICTPI